MSTMLKLQLFQSTYEVCASSLPFYFCPYHESPLTLTLWKLGPHRTITLHNQKAGVMDLLKGIDHALCDHNMTVEYAARVRVMQVAGQAQHFCHRRLVKEQLFNKHMCGKVELGEFACEKSWVILKYLDVQNE